MTSRASLASLLPGRRAFEIAGLLGGVVLATLLVNRLDLDRSIARHFYDPKSGWLALDAPWPMFLYKYGPWPAIAFGVLCLFTLVAGRFAGRVARRVQSLVPRAVAAHYLLVLLLGPGLLINSAMKQHLARPRPNALVEFGGGEVHVPALKAQWTVGGASFPCGHASMGFMLAAPFFPLRRRRKRIARAALALGTLAGIGIGFARIVVGAHFLTDVLWSGGIVFGTCVALAPLVGRRMADESPAALPLVSSDAA